MIPTSFLGSPRKDTETDRTTRRRSEAVTDAFARKTTGLDFSRKSAPAMPTSGTGSLADLYGSFAFKSDIARRDERDAVLDKLPQPVARLSQIHGITDLDLLRTIGIVHKACATMGGQPVQVFASDIGRAMSVTSQRADALLSEAVSRGFIERKPNHHWKTRL